MKRRTDRERGGEDEVARNVAFVPNTQPSAAARVSGDVNGKIMPIERANEKAFLAAAMHA